MTTKVTSGLISADAASVDLNIDAGTLYVDASANSVGMGTTSPAGNLHISATGEARLILEGDSDNDSGEESSLLELRTDGGAVRHRVEATGTGGNDLKITAGADQTTNTLNSEIIFQTKTANSSTAERMRIDHNGNVGIGNTGPRQKFSVTGPLVSTGALATFGSAGSYTDGAFDGTALDYYDSGARNWCWGTGSARGTFVWNQLYNDGTNQITSMKLDTGGNVVLGGIAAAAREPLHVHRPSTSDVQVHLTNSATGNTSGDGLTIFANSTTAGFWMRENGNLRFATNNTERGEFDVNGMFLPAADDTYDIGSSAKRWRNMYTADLHLSNEGKQNDVDGTSGNWTIQEGENDLFLINNKNGKRFKFSLEEVE